MLKLNTPLEKETYSIIRKAMNYEENCNTECKCNPKILSSRYSGRIKGVVFHLSASAANTESDWPDFSNNILG